LSTCRMTTPRGSSQCCKTLWARGWVVVLSWWSSPLHAETALPEVNSFRRECQPFCNIDRCFPGVGASLVNSVTDVTYSEVGVSGLT
jgi:hypothetical protein